MKYFWHVHHEILAEPSDNIEERIEYIKNNKSSEEIEIRLRLLKEVKGQLPRAYAEAWKAYDDAGKARDDACKAYAEAGKAYACEIEALHKIECPDCPWDGKTIFPKGEEK